MMFNGISAEKVDPFYPVVYGTNTNVVPEKLDRCMAHPQAQGDYHYHSAGPCIADPTIETLLNTRP